LTAGGQASPGSAADKEWQPGLAGPRAPVSGVAASSVDLADQAVKLRGAGDDSEEVNTDLITGVWDDLLRVVASVMGEYATAGLVVGKLCSSKRQQNALTSAIKEYGALCTPPWCGEHWRLASTPLPVTKARLTRGGRPHRPARPGCRPAGLAENLTAAAGEASPGDRGRPLGRWDTAHRPGWPGR